ncbi:conjugal transfer protein [Desulfofundulus thermocisternus]|uniref:conjugal transfer protein n=1 Tax=Desulfofundulus thermocisternus TaxID=42471 RepID=UPI00217ECD11|nr:conjugal transfer protein [Desulfofundulus thermocisternus]MCS5697264.1 conjugal transfer protein [Desulfofundulus thermocisternus]
MSDERRFNSYRSLFKIHFKIYEVGGKPLPRPVPLDGLIIGLVLYFPLLPLGHMLSPSHPWLITLVLAAGAACALLQLDPQGKFAPVFIKDLVLYFFRPKTTNLAGRVIQRFHRRKINWEALEVVEN